MRSRSARAVSNVFDSSRAASAASRVARSAPPASPRAARRAMGRKPRSGFGMEWRHGIRQRGNERRLGSARRAKALEFSSHVDTSFRDRRRDRPLRGAAVRVRRQRELRRGPVEPLPRRSRGGRRGMAALLPGAIRGGRGGARARFRRPAAVPGAPPGADGRRGLRPADRGRPPTDPRRRGPDRREHGAQSRGPDGDDTAADSHQAPGREPSPHQRGTGLGGALRRSPSRSSSPGRSSRP